MTYHEIGESTMNASPVLRKSTEAKKNQEGQPRKAIPPFFILLASLR